MAKEDYLEGYGQGLKRGKENPITGPINKELDKVFGNIHNSAKRGVDQGYNEMKAAKKAEAIRPKFDDNYKKGGCVKMSKGGSASSRADGCATRGKTKGRIV